MSDVELEVVKGPLHFRGRGPQEWVEEQFAKVFAPNFLHATPGGDKGITSGNAGQIAPTEGPPGKDQKARWMSQQQITQDELDLLFHHDNGEYHFIAPAIPGASNKDRCINAYILVGLRSFLLGREGRFTDEEGRTICLQYGVYDQNNHSSKVLSSLRPEITGSKGSGWQLTAPGRIKAAELIKQVAGGQ